MRQIDVAVGGGWLADKFHIKWVLFSMYVLAAISITLLGVRMPTEALFFVIGLLAMALPLQQNFIAIAIPAVIAAVAVAMIHHSRSASAQHEYVSPGIPEPLMVRVSGARK